MFYFLLSTSVSFNPWALAYIKYIFNKSFQFYSTILTNPEIVFIVKTMNPVLARIENVKTLFDLLKMLSVAV